MKFLYNMLFEIIYTTEMFILLKIENLKQKFILKKERKILIFSIYFFKCLIIERVNTEEKGRIRKKSIR